MQLLHRRVVVGIVVMLKKYVVKVAGGEVCKVAAPSLLFLRNSQFKDSVQDFLATLRHKVTIPT